jgi:FkbM family methyltransferase
MEPARVRRQELRDVDIVDAVTWLAYAGLDVRHGFRGVPRTVNGEAIRFPARWSRYYPATYEPAKAAFLRERSPRGATVLDLGAHIGLFSVQLARSVGPSGRVVSFEPAPHTAAVLRRTIRCNGLASVVSVRQAAVAGAGAGRSGEVELFETGEDCSNASSLVRTDRTRDAVRVAATTLDDLVDDERLTVAVVKMDIEGAELEVLEGAPVLLAHQRPAMTIEVHPLELRASRRDPREVFDVLVGHGYAVTEGERPLDRASFDRVGCFEVQALHPGRP